MENFDRLTALPGTAQEQAWLKERLETLSIREGYALTAALTQSPPDSMGSAIDLCCSLDDFEICNAGSYEELGKLCLMGYRLPKEVQPHVDPCRLGEQYAEEHPGLFVGDSFVVYPCENHILHRKPGTPLPEDNDWSVKLKLASPSCPEGVWLRLPDFGPTEEPLALKKLGVGKVGDCTLLEARCILPEAGNLLEQCQRLMLDSLLESGRKFPYSVYLEASKKAVDAGNKERVWSLIEQSGQYVSDEIPASFCGEVLLLACLDKQYMVKPLIERCSNEQIAAASPELLRAFAMRADFHTMSLLVEKGISGGDCAANILHTLTYEGRNNWMAESLLQQRMWVDPGDYNALYACVKNDAVDVCKLLLDGGMDFDAYMRWANSHSDHSHVETIEALAEHWEEIQAMKQDDAPEDGGMTLA